MTREEIRAALTERQALIATLDGEVRGEPLMGQLGVACAIRNRVNADLGLDNKPDWWGEGYRGVCLAPAQFSCWWGQDANTEHVYALAASLIVGKTQPIEARRLAWIADGVIGDAVEDVTNGATHYCTRHIFETHPPAWALGRTPVAEWGHHVFFAGVER
jgi:hypothetical protein